MTSDDLLIALLIVLNRFGTVVLGDHVLDLDELGIDWLHPPGLAGRSKAVFSADAVWVFDRAVAIARLDGAGPTRPAHMLAALADVDYGLARTLRERYALSSAAWRAAVAKWEQTLAAPAGSVPMEDGMLSPETVAEELQLHIQTVRGYIRTGKLPALRVAGERVLRIRRRDMLRLLEPLVIESTPARAG